VLHLTAVCQTMLIRRPDSGNVSDEPAQCTHTHSLDQRPRCPRIAIWRAGLRRLMRNYRIEEKEPGQASGQPSATRAVSHEPRPLPDRTVRHHRRRVGSAPPAAWSGTRETVRDAAIALTHRGLYPSASYIADLLGDRNVMRSHTAQAVWREVLSDLGWDRPNMELRAVMAQTA
jgi:hypothetical protein